MIFFLIVAWTAIVLFAGWRLGRGRRQALTTEEWIDAYLLGTGSGAAELVTQLLEGGHGPSTDSPHRAK